MCIALLNRELLSQGRTLTEIEVEYNKGWFCHDKAIAYRRPDLTKQAEKLLRKGHRAVFDLTLKSYAIHAKSKRL